LVCVDENRLLKDIENLLNFKIPKEVVAGYEPDPSIKAEPISRGRSQLQAPGKRTGKRKPNQTNRKQNPGSRRARASKNARRRTPT